MLGKLKYKKKVEKKYYCNNKYINSYKDEVKKGANPMKFKIILGEEIVERFHNKKAAQITREEFKNRFSKKKAPSKIKKVKA